MQATQNDTNKKKRVLIQLRSSYEEKITLKEFARLAGMNITDFIKSRTLQKPPRMKVVTPEREILLRMLSELSKIGSNINQIAKVMNTEKKTFYSVAVKETLISQTLEEMNEVSSHILNALNKSEGHGDQREDQR